MEAKRVVRIIIFVVIILAIFYFVPKGKVEVDSGRQIVMGTFAHIIAVAEHRDIAQKGVEDALTSLRQIEALASIHLGDSEITRVNTLACFGPVEVSDPLFEILQAAVDYGRLTNGAFDVTVGPLVELWEKSADANHTPDTIQIEKALTKIGFEKIYLNPDGKTVRLGAEGMKLDLGGIAKGYAIDRAIEALKEAGATSGMVDVGGDIRCFGVPANGKKHWLIGLQDPDLSEKEQNLLVLKLGDAAVATSGDYRRFVMIGDESYSHIIDTQTGQSATRLSSVTVITDKAVDTDALATAVSVLGPEEGLKLIESLADVEAIVISPGPDYWIGATSGAEKYITKSRTKVQSYTGGSF